MKQLTQNEINIIAQALGSSGFYEYLQEQMEDQNGIYPGELPLLDKLFKEFDYMANKEELYLIWKKETVFHKSLFKRFDQVKNGDIAFYVSEAHGLIRNEEPAGVIRWKGTYQEMQQIPKLKPYTYEIERRSLSTLYSKYKYVLVQGPGQVDHMLNYNGDKLGVIALRPDKL